MKEEQAFQEEKQQNVSTEEATETNQQEEPVNEAAALEAQEGDTELAKLRVEAEAAQQRFLLTPA
ncbi:nucleotide exchange factor GrpE, partial [Paenibacillus sp. 28ISP30-2]|nr:nucleotide exchange factor GrpE [Paenibacillus sp. 28ISP30-2]